MTTDDRPILLVDGMNLFVRSYCAFPSMSSHGYQVGGVVGFLKTLRKIANEQHPKAIYIAWEGGGSAKRRGLYNDYKANRKPEKLNRFYEDDIPDTSENKSQQIVALTSLLKNLPVFQVYVSDCEGDDVIAYLARYMFQDEQKIIVSSDKDFYQLLNDKTRIYSLHKKSIVTAADVLLESNITAKNFALAKSFCGDASDNIPGVQGLGFKTLAKRFPFFGTEQDVTISDVVNYSHTYAKKSAIYQKVIDNEDLVKRNWQLIYLDSSSITPYQIEHIEFVINTFKPTINKMAFIKRLIAEGISDFEVDNFFYTFLGINIS